MITFLISFAAGFACGVYRDAISTKARELYIKYSEKR